MNRTNMARRRACVCWSWRGRAYPSVVNRAHGDSVSGRDRQKRIRERIEELSGYVRRRLTGLGGLTLATPAHPALHGAMTAFRLPPGRDAIALRRGLWEKWRIEAPIIERPEGLLILASTHFYNTEAEVDRLAEALRSFFRKPYCRLRPRRLGASNRRSRSNCPSVCVKSKLFI